MVCAASPGPPAWAHGARISGFTRPPVRQLLPTGGPDLGWRTDFDEHWTVGVKIGRGAFGEVHSGTHTTSGAKAAIKTMPKERAGWTRETALSKIERETAVLTALNDAAHGGVVRLLECFEDDDYVRLVTELCRGGDLEAYAEDCGTLDEASLARVAYEVMCTVKGFHDAGYVHGDVKPGNFCLVEPSCFIAVSMPAGGLKAVDVGCSQAVDGRLSRRAGSPLFMAPEVFAQDFSFKADVWAAGVMLYWLFSGTYPVASAVPDLHSAKVCEIAEAVSTCDADFDADVWRGISSDGRDFLARCLARDEATRMDVEAALVHPWILRMGAPQQLPNTGPDLGWRTDFGEEWNLGQTIGHGSFGSVHGGTHKTSGTEAVVKTMPKKRAGWSREKALSKIARESAVLTALEPHDGVVSLLEHFEDGDNVRLVMELCRGGDLEAHLELCGTLDEASLARVAYEVLSTVKGFHDAGYVHGDVKPGNFVLIEPSCSISASMPAGGLKAVDVGCSQAVDGRLSKRSGSPLFMAPEVFAGDFSFKADVWAAGVMLYWLFSGTYPVASVVPDLHSLNVCEIAYAVKKRDAVFDADVWRGLSSDGRDFLARCLVRDEAKRLDVDAALVHPWILRMGAPRESNQEERTDARSEQQPAASRSSSSPQQQQL
ncbi:hypothetical protein FOA52_009769 [Chlamydomonas sp. UWO 241]|nr:hypothetical protein FOA52_009769 [Chlamydomonas sp. UWO 241]